MKSKQYERGQMQMAVYAGFPAALNALVIAKEVFGEQNLSAVE